MTAPQDKVLTGIALPLNWERHWDCLNEREQDILRARTGNGVPVESLVSLARKHVLTRERIRQIEVVALRRLDDRWQEDQALSDLLCVARRTITRAIARHGNLRHVASHRGTQAWRNKASAFDSSIKLMMRELQSLLGILDELYPGELDPPAESSGD